MFTKLVIKLARMNWILFILIVALSIFGLVCIYSATYMRDNIYLAKSWERQAAWICIGLVIYFVASLTPYQWLKWMALPVYLAGLGLLVFVHFRGTALSGARSWIDLGPITFQPSQIALLGVILLVAAAFSQLKIPLQRQPFLLLIIACAVVAAPLILIIEQPDLGSALVLGPAFLCMLFAAGVRKRYLISMILAAAIVIPIGINFMLRSYQRQRFLVFLDPDLDPQGAGWTINQSLQAIGSGGFSGRGFKAEGTLTEMGFLPSTVVHNDFIFPVIAETFGFIGGAMLITGFALLLILVIYIAQRAADDFGAIIATGIAGVLFTHIFINIGMTIALTPITGLPLPFISYGGTFMVVLMSMMGVVQSIAVHRKPIEVDE